MFLNLCLFGLCKIYGADAGTNTPGITDCCGPNAIILEETKTDPDELTQAFYICIAADNVMNTPMFRCYFEEYLDETYGLRLKLPLTLRRGMKTSTVIKMISAMVGLNLKGLNLIFLRKQQLETIDFDLFLDNRNKDKEICIY